MRTLVFSFFFLTSSICFANQAIHQHSKPIISDSAIFFVNDDIKLEARIDSGATRSSVNAHNIRVKNASKNMKDNIGEMVAFDIVDATNKHHPMQSKIIDVKTVKTPQGREHRYLVELYFSWNGKKTKIAVNLRDRSKLEYKLLVGRDWLDDNAVIDVAPKSIIGEVADFIVAEDFKLTARIDSGAASTSINATDIKVMNSARNMTNNVGKLVSFNMSNKDGKVKRITAPIEEVVEINNAISSEYRYKVKMKIQWQNRVQMLNVNLKDRSRLTYKMLIGRDWLSDNAIIDTAK